MPVQVNYPDAPKYLHSFGRRQMRGLRGKKAERFEQMLPPLQLDAAALNLPKHQPLWLEIGYGGGEHLAAQAKHHPDVCYIGCEVFVNGIASCLHHIETHGLKNVRLFTEDARLLLEALPNQSLEKVFILFPDPWPKRKHNKRRLVNPETLEFLARIMKPGGTLRLATDDAEYASWMLVQMMNDTRFLWQAETSADWKNQPRDHITTRYQAKAAKVGRPSVFLDFTRK